MTRLPERHTRNQCEPPFQAKNKETNQKDTEMGAVDRLDTENKTSQRMRKRGGGAGPKGQRGGIWKQ